MLDPRPLIKPLAITVAVGLVWLGGYRTGHETASHAAAIELGTVQRAHADERAMLADAKARELALALTDKTRLEQQATTIGWELLQTRSALIQAHNRLKQRIPDAIRHDGPRFTGLGPDGLQLYRVALGYPERDPGVPATDAGDAAEAGQAAGAGEGLPPEDLLAHASDYGRWCQETDARLSAFIELHQEARDGHL